MIAEEIGRLLTVDSIEMVRHEDDRVAAVVAGWGAVAPPVPAGTRVPLGGRNAASLVFRTGRAARVDDYGSASGSLAERVTAGGVRSAVATPIFASSLVRRRKLRILYRHSTPMTPAAAGSAR